MITISGQLAWPSNFQFFAQLAGERQATIRAYEASREVSYDWPDFSAFTAWAEGRPAATEPATRQLDAGAVATARRERHRFEAAANSVSLVEQLGSAGAFDRAPLEHLPNLDLHADAPQDTFYRDDPVTRKRSLHQLKSTAARADNEARRKRTRMTIYTAPSGKVHAHTNVGDDVIHSVVDTTANVNAPLPSAAPVEGENDAGPEGSTSGSGSDVAEVGTSETTPSAAAPASSAQARPRRKRGRKKLTQKEKCARGYRGYGGHSTASFATADGRTTTMRGHSVGFADTIPKPSAEVVKLTGTIKPYAGHDARPLVSRNGRLVPGRKPITSMTSNDNPRCYYPESCSRGGATLGADIKNHQHEAPTRAAGGTYVQSCAIGAASTRLKGGLRIPDAYHYLRDVPGDAEPYARFRPQENLRSDGEAEWSAHSRPVATFPTPKRWDSSSSLAALFPAATFQPAPPTPNFLPEFYEHGQVETEEEVPLHELRSDSYGGTYLAFRRTSADGGPYRYEMGRLAPPFEDPSQLPAATWSSTTSSAGTESAVDGKGKERVRSDEEEEEEEEDRGRAQ